MSARGLNRDRLVAIAHEYVATNGLDALTVRRLAAAAEVTPGALYKHFKDRRDLQRAMADSIYATIDLKDIDTTAPRIEQVILCCERMRSAMLRFRDGGRILAGSYSPFAATVTISTTLRKLLEGIISSLFDAGDIAFTLRNYIIGFVIEEQAYITLAASGEWDALVQRLPRPAIADGRNSDAVTILTDDRDRRFRAGLEVILTGITI